MLERFFCDGYVVAAGAVPERACHDALRVVNKSLETAGEGSRDKRVYSDAPVVDLFNRCPGVREVAAELLGVPPERLPYVPGAQVALRFPGTLCDASFRPVPWWSSLWHIDGLPSAENGIAEGTIANFTLLVGVCLRDVLEDMAGNLVVYPRSHFATQDYFRRNGFEAAKRGLTELPPLPLADPVQVKLRKGDVVFAHYSLAHSIAPNAQHEIRAMVYFRLNQRGPGFHPAPMLDVWTDFSPRFAPLAAAFFSSAASKNRTDGGVVARAAGYVDAEARVTLLKQAREGDAEKKKLAAAAEECLAQHRWSEAVVHFRALALSAPDDVFCLLKLGLCLTASEKTNLEEGETILRSLIDDRAPSLAQAAVFLARNLQRQVAECGAGEAKRKEAALFATRGLLHCAAAPDVAVEAVKVLAELEAPELAAVAAAAAERYPELSAQLTSAAQRDEKTVLWAAGKKWLSSEPKSLPEGKQLFGHLVQRFPDDFWARIVYSSCLLWGGDPSEAITHLRQARALDPNREGFFFPHSFAVLAQALAAAGRGEEAVREVEAMLRARLVLAQPDHRHKLVDALQVCADVLLERERTRYDSIRDAAVALFPEMEPRLLAVAKKESACAIQ